MSGEVADRIASPWGERTPVPRGAEWPVRVDQQLEEGLGEQDVDRWVQSACVLCSHGCGLDAAVKDGRIVGVRGRATGLAGLFEACHEETWNQLKWIKTKVKEASAQVLAGG